MDMILSWISECRDHHELCRRESLARETCKFARILDVGRDQDMPMIRLRKFEEIPHNATYTTLSHCWGGVGIPVLNESTHKQYREAIMIKELPQTFKDAIQLVRRLGVQYLWIDSLCIVQDSNEDWLEQASLMDQIYQGSLFNIAATRSSHPYGDLFVEGNPILITPLRVTITNALPGNIDGFYDVGDDFSGEWVSQVALSPLETRAWVVQELLLAPRVVHFAKSMLFWECAQLRTSEASTIGRANQSGWKHEKVDFKKWDSFSKDLLGTPSSRPWGLNYIWLFVKAMLHSDGIECTGDLLAHSPEALIRAKRDCYEEDWSQTHQLISYWAAIMNHYGNANLTRINDSLFAVARLAKILSSRTGICFFVRHWLYQLPRQLL